MATERQDPAAATLIRRAAGARHVTSTRTQATSHAHHAGNDTAITPISTLFARDCHRAK